MDITRKQGFLSYLQGQQDAFEKIRQTCVNEIARLEPKIEQQIKEIQFDERTER
jgi:hypothetical protein